MPSQPARALRRRRRGVLSPLPLPRAPTPCAPVRRRRARWRTHLHHNHRDHRGIGARVRAGSPTMTGQCEKSTHGRSEINREIRYETTWDTTLAPRSWRPPKSHHRPKTKPDANAPPRSSPCTASVLCLTIWPRLPTTASSLPWLMPSPSSSSLDRPRCSAKLSSCSGFAWNVPGNAFANVLFHSERQQVDSRMLSKFRLGYTRHPNWEREGARKGNGYRRIIPACSCIGRPAVSGRYREAHAAIRRCASSRR